MVLAEIKRIGFCEMGIMTNKGIESMNV